MRAMFWKELRENALWAILAFCVVSLVFAYSNWTVVSYNNVRFYLKPDCVYALGGPLAVLAPLAGLLIGFLQIVHELRRDRWAFLIHRPATRSTLFLGKAMAGMALYLAATALPYGVALWWLVRHVRLMVPFDFVMTEGALCNLLLGPLFYFAAILTAIRPARWYGSRALPLAAAAAVAILESNLDSFWWVLSSTLLGIGIFAVAACGAFLTDGAYRNQPPWMRAALGAVMYAGIVAIGSVILALLDTYLGTFCWAALGTAICICIFVAAAWSGFVTVADYRMQPSWKRAMFGAALFSGIIALGSTMVAMMNRYADAEASKLATTVLNIERNHFYWYEVEDGGDIIWNDGVDTSVAEFRMQGNEVLRRGPKIDSKAPALVAGRVVKLNGPDDAPWSYSSRDELRNSIPTFREARSGYTALEGAQETWLYIPRQRRFVGYSNDNLHRIGFLGPAGFSVAGKDGGSGGNDRFSVDPIDGNDLRANDQGSYSSLYGTQPYNGNALPLHIRDGIFWADFVHHRLVPLVSAGAGVRSISRVLYTWPLTGNEPVNSPFSNLNEYIFLVTNKDMRMFDRSGKLVFSQPLEHDYRHYDIVVYIEPHGPRFLIRYKDATTSVAVGYITALSATGKVLAHYTLPPLPNTASRPEPALPDDYISPSEQESPIHVFAALWTPNAVFPLQGMVAEVLHQLPHSWELQFAWVNETWDPSFVQLWIVQSCLAVAGSVLLVLLIGYRCVFSRREVIAWCIGALLFGPSAVLLLLSLRGWPLRKRCPSCGKLRVVDRQWCEHCGAPFPSPAFAATQMFEPAPTTLKLVT